MESLFNILFKTSKLRDWHHLTAIRLERYSKFFYKAMEANDLDEIAKFAETLLDLKEFLNKEEYLVDMNEDERKFIAYAHSTIDYLVGLSKI